MVCKHVQVMQVYSKSSCTAQALIYLINPHALMVSVLISEISRCGDGFPPDGRPPDRHRTVLERRCDVKLQ